MAASDRSVNRSLNPSLNRAQAAIGAWLAVGAMGFALLPWYLSADKTLLQSLPGVLGSADTASGLVQAALRGKWWLWIALAALSVAALGWRLQPGRAQGRVLVAGAGIGLVGLLASGFAIGAKGWAFEWLNASLGALPAGQFGIGLGAALTLLALLMLLDAGIARLGGFRGDGFFASAAVVCGALLALFVTLPVLRALSGAFFDEAGKASITAVWERIGNERTWGLSCLNVFSAGQRCGVA